MVEQPPLHIVRDNPAVSDKYFNPGDSLNNIFCELLEEKRLTRGFLNIVRDNPVVSDKYFNPGDDDQNYDSLNISNQVMTVQLMIP